MSTLTFVVVSWVSYFASRYISFPLLLTACVISLSIVLWKAPAQHPDNPIDKDARPRLKRMCIIWSVSVLFITMVCEFLSFSNYALMFALSSLSATVTFIVKINPVEITFENENSKHRL